MSVYIVTNRRVSKGKIVNKGRERGQSCFRIAECSIDQTPGVHPSQAVSYELLPDISDPSQYRRRNGKSRAMADIVHTPDKLRGSERMFAELYKAMVAAPQAMHGRSDVLFFIHGFAYDLDDSLKHIYQLHQRYVADQNSPVKHLVYFSWPTIGHMGLTYWDDQEDAEIAGAVVARLFNLLRGFFIDMFELGDLQRCDHKFHLMAHSMGNQVLEHAIRAICKQKYYQLFDETLLLNADVGYDVFAQNEAFRDLETLSERTHVYIHRSDDALRVSRYTKNFQRRLGSKGPRSPADLPADVYIVDTTCAEQDVDTHWFNELKERAVDHWGYLYRGEVIDDILQVLNGIDEDDVASRQRWHDVPRYYYLGGDAPLVAAQDSD